MKTLSLKTGEQIPVLGLGTWGMGERPQDKNNEIAVIQAALDMGLELIDTAEMYGDGGAEDILGAALAGRRSQAYLVSKVYPHNAGTENAIRACENSLRRLKTDFIDLYLLHWRGSVPLAHTVAAFEKLKKDGKIKQWGVSNFDVADMQDLFTEAPENACVVNQVLYHLDERGTEYDLLPFLQKNHIAMMAYSPLGQGSILNDPTLTRLAKSYNVTTATIAIAFVLLSPYVIAIPKTARIHRLADILAAGKITLASEDIEILNKRFIPPNRKRPLSML